MLKHAEQVMLCGMAVGIYGNSFVRLNGCQVRRMLTYADEC